MASVDRFAWLVGDWLSPHKEKTDALRFGVIHLRFFNQGSGLVSVFRG